MESQFSHSRIINGRTRNRAWVCWAQDTTHTAYNNSNSYPAAMVLNNTLLVKPPLFELHTHTHTHKQHAYIWLNSLGNQARKWPVFQRKAQSLGIIWTTEHQVHQNLTQENGRMPWTSFCSAPDWHTQERKMLSIPNSGTEKKAWSYTWAVISEYIQNCNSLREIHEWLNLSCSFANKEYMNYHL